MHTDGLSAEELMVTEESEHTWWLSCIFEDVMLEAMCAHSLSVTAFSLCISQYFKYSIRDAYILILILTF